MDHNYTDDAIEVLDNGGHVVLQMRLLPDRLQIRAEWHDAYGDGAQLTECDASKHEPPLSVCAQKFGPGWPEKEQKVILKPMFKYPSKKYWGVYAH
jgi:hypothetical protein